MLTQNDKNISGEFLNIAGERYYVIRNINKMSPLFITVTSDSDHWLFISSYGGLTAGRVSPETALFPYQPVDKIHDSWIHTGTKTLLSIITEGHQYIWEPFNIEQENRYAFNRNIYKNILGNRLCFEEINHKLKLAFRYTWSTSDLYGFVRHCELENLGAQSLKINLVDGIQNILPAGTPRFAQTNTSNLVDAYKWTELDVETGLALYTLNSGISDRADPRESLKANTVYCLGVKEKKVLLSTEQIEDFRQGKTVQQETHKRGIRGAYLINQIVELSPQSSTNWQFVANIEQTQGKVVALQRELGNPSVHAKEVVKSINKGSENLERIMAASDAYQSTSEENVSVHHYANVLFNILRGGTFYNQYQIDSNDFVNTIKHFNNATYHRNQDQLENLPETVVYDRLLKIITATGDSQLIRLSSEYLPITFGRRHGDPSRPWNQFTIKLKDKIGNRLLSYEGNWRDIFQNWEALLFSYPEFIESVIAKFVNASTIDGYNPYRITKDGIDWEIEEPDEPWSNIGYWGDHQIIYLLKLLELSNKFHPKRLGHLLRQPIFSYANVPYRIKPFEALLENAKNTVDYDVVLADKIQQRVARMGADGKLVLDQNDEVYLVNLFEKLLVPLLSKLGNFVIDGGIWLNTQRPEWNDANNALVGQGLSMVTLYYLRRYVSFMQQLLAGENEPISLSKELHQWLTETATALSNIRPRLSDSPVSPGQRYKLLNELGQASDRYRRVVYRQASFSGKIDQSLSQTRNLLKDALAVIDHSIDNNRRKDGMYHAYNLLSLQQDACEVENLYPMLEGQVAALSAGSITPEQAVLQLEALFNSDLYRQDQHSFMLYPDRKLPSFLEKNRIPDKDVKAISLLQRMLADKDERILLLDVDGCYRFNAELITLADLNNQLDKLQDRYGNILESAREPIQSLYKKVFHHKAYTGRSGTMFGFEGLGCIYWHMVAKLLLAVQENFFSALDQRADDIICRKLGRLYYRVRKGIGFNKGPDEYGAFPTDPYSHTPKHAGAQQPGMTGQVKEEILTRFGELGVRVCEGVARFQPSLLRVCEFVSKPQKYKYLDVQGKWQELTVPPSGLAFSWCQVPVIYSLNDQEEPSLTIIMNDGKRQTFDQLELPEHISYELFQRSGLVRQISILVHSSQLFDG